MKRSSFRLSRCASIALVLGLLATAAPRAALADPAATQGVDALFDAGVAAFDRGDFVAAEKAYEAAWALKQTHDLAGNLGATKLALEKFVEAATLLERCLRLFPVTGDPKHRAQIELALATARKHVGNLRITAPAGARVTVDGAAVGTAPFAEEIVLLVGSHRVLATLNGRTSTEQTIEVKPGAHANATIELADDPADEGRALWPAFVLGGVGVAAVGTGAAFLGLSAASEGDAEDLSSSIRANGGGCVAGARNHDDRCATLAGLSADAASQHDAAVPLFVVGGAALLGAGVYLAWPLVMGDEASLEVGVRASLGDVRIEGRF